ncbi:STAS domain-containing protein [Actinoallomurus iriomotensis]|uniref:Anti-anti-sigma factor n=1 Tax=Actinoallomurus iriomotensis TaxID=478107 RepID=A0A9W6RKE9_9ACTN|nr:STAS domain-containing protein [Actinoallomurus iriomotensis]GLY77786.1 anti-anti-sigma factor [Actinoallomurus iriomotensis]
MTAEAGAGRVSVLRMGDILIAAIQQELTDESALALQQDLTEMAAAGARGVVIEISGVEIVDSFLARVLSEIAAATNMLAGRTVVAGMRPSVAITLVEMGLGLRGLETARSLEDAMAVFRGQAGR